MKTRISILVGFLLLGVFSFSQTDRVQISGYLQNELNEPLDGITIFNNDSLEGTISNATGGFKIDVAPNDRITFKAVNYDAITLIVTDKTLEQRIISLTLREGINVLDEIVLNGDQNLTINLKRLKETNPQLEQMTGYSVAWTPAVDRMENTFNDLQRQPDEYGLRHDALREYEPDGAFFNLVGLLAAVILNVALNALDIDFGSATTVQERFDVAILKNQIESQELIAFLDIPEDQLYEYMYFATDQGLNSTMMQPENELFLLQFLSDTATAFKKRKKQ